MRFLLDTSICVPLINGTDAKLTGHVLQLRKNRLVLCSVVKAELYFGARHSARVAENLDRVERFCSVFDSLPFDDGAAGHYGSIRAQLVREGRIIGANDLLIAAIALAADVTLATRNVGEFKRIPSLAIEPW